MKGFKLRRSLLALAIMLAPAAALASRVVTDEAGRKVTVPDHPHRVVCLVPAVTDTVFALGAGDDVAAISDYTTYPPEALKKPSIGSLVKPSIETIVALHPDLVIGTQIPGSQETSSQLQAVGIPVYLIDPHGLAGILQTVTHVGEALNRVAQATALNQDLTHRIDAVKARTAGKPGPRVFVPVWYDPIITIGKRTFMSEIIQTAGATSVTNDLDQDWPQISIEAVLARAPDALVLIRDGKIKVETLAQRPGWSSLQAVKDRKVYYVDSGIEIPSPMAIRSLEELAKEFHP